MRALRIVDWKNLAVSLSMTHLCIGASFHTIQVPAGKGRTPVRIRFVHLHLPFAFVTISWHPNP